MMRAAVRTEKGTNHPPRMSSVASGSRLLLCGWWLFSTFCTFFFFFFFGRFFSASLANCVCFGGIVCLKCVLTTSRLLFLWYDRLTFSKTVLAVSRSRTLSLTVVQCFGTLLTVSRLQTVVLLGGFLRRRSWEHRAETGGGREVFAPLRRTKHASVSHSSVTIVRYRGPLTAWVVGILVAWLVYWSMTDWLTDWLIGWLTDWLVDWLTD